MSNTENNVKKNFIASVYEWVEVVCVALFVVVLLFTFVFRLVTVDGPSMNNTLQHGDRLIISHLFYTPKTGDVVVLQNANSTEFPDPIIKRVIATEGETVDIDPETWTVSVTDKDGNVTVLDESYVNRVDGNMRIGTYGDSFFYKNVITESEYPHTVPEGHVFVMGDNRNHSLDSRLLGDIDERMILGKAYIRVLPNPTVNF